MDLEDIKMLTKSQILSKDTLQEIFEEEGVNRVELLINLSARAKELKIKSEFEEFKKAFEKEINAFKKAQQEKALQEVQQQEQAKHTYMFFTDEDDVSTSNTGEWTIDESGIYYYWGSTKIYACYYPVAIAKRFVNVESNKEEWELAWWKDNEKRTIKVARSVAMSATKIVQLSDYGFPVTSENARNLVRYLSEYEKFNTNVSLYGDYREQLYESVFDKMFFDTMFANDGKVKDELNSIINPNYIIDYNNIFNTQYEVDEYLNIYIIGVKNKNQPNYGIPDFVLGIRKFAFSNLNALKDVIIKDGVKFIEEGAFKDSNNIFSYAGLLIVQPFIPLLKDIIPQLLPKCNEECLSILNSL